MMPVLHVLWFAVLFTVAVGDLEDPVLYLWPLPQSVKCDKDFYTVSETFTFQGTGDGGELATLTAAFERYRPFVSPDTLKTHKLGDNAALEMLVVDVASADETLNLETDESCELPLRALSPLYVRSGNNCHSSGIDHIIQT